jgi:hypothetical protein
MAGAMGETWENVTETSRAVHRFRARDVLTALNSAGYTIEQGWRTDMENAPRDGTRVLLWAPGWKEPATGWNYSKRDPWQDCPYSATRDDYAPTHWKPATPPEQSQ